MQRPIRPPILAARHVAEKVAVRKLKRNNNLYFNLNTAMWLTDEVVDAIQAVPFVLNDELVFEEDMQHRHFFPNMERRENEKT